MVSGIIEVISSRVQTQLNAFLATEISSLLAVTKAEMSTFMEAQVAEMRAQYEKEVLELRKELDVLRVASEKQANWHVVEPDLMSEVIKQQGEYIVLNVGGMVRSI